MLSGSGRNSERQINVNGIPVGKDHRLQLILEWLKIVSPGKVLSLEYASGDASFRRYFRIVLAERSLIVMDAPPQVERIRSFIQINRLFDAAGVFVPEIVEFDEHQGFMLLGDLGSTCYLSRLDMESASILYRDAMDVLGLFHNNIDFEKCGLPEYDEDLLQRELKLFEDWFLSGKLGIRLSDAELKMFENLKTFLTAVMLEQPKVVVHRDFHSRNLMVVDGPNPGVLDFQDAVTGPLTYDLVSLLRDCYIAWPQTSIDQWVAEYFSNLDLHGVDFEEFYRWFDLTGLQRHLKAVGIFSRLDIRDGKPGYLADIPRTLRYIQAVAGKYTELSSLSSFLTTTVAERMEEVFSK